MVFIKYYNNIEHYVVDSIDKICQRYQVFSSVW